MDGNKDGCLFGWLLSLLNDPDDDPTKLGAGSVPFRKREYLFSKAERSFYGVLLQAITHEHVIFAKVRLCDIVEVIPGTEKWRSHYNRISSKHVDFILCDSRYIRPLLVIELDDASHARADRQERAVLVDRILAAAKIPILRCPAKAAYAPKELQGKIMGLLRV